MLGPPWRPAPAAWSLDGARLALITPPTPGLVRALLLADDDPVLGAVSILTEVTAPSDRGKLMRALLDPEAPPLRGRTVALIADDLVYAVTGWRRWTLARLWAHTLGGWSIIGGRLIAAGVDVAALPIPDASAAVYATWHQLYRDPDAWQRFDDGLQREPARHVRRVIEEQDAAQAEAAFAAAQAMVR